jgi:hypothetical protein
LIKKFTLLITGKIRDPDEFMRNLLVYEEWIFHGWIDTLIFSGWREDLHDGCIGRLRSMGAKILLTDPPEFRSRGNVFHQIKSFYCGLSDVPDDTIVLKSRTDKVWLNFSPEKALARFHNSLPTGSRSPFAQRIHVAAMLPLQPFFINDIMLMGQASDLRKLLSFDMWFELEQGLLNAEQIFHYHPHSRGDDIWRAFYRVNPGLIHSDADTSRKLIRTLLKNEVYLRAVAEYLLAFVDGYSIGIGREHEFVKPNQVSIDALIDQPANNHFDGIRFAEGANTLEAVSNDAVTHLLDMPISTKDERSFRSIAQEKPLSKSVITTWSELLTLELRRDFPNIAHNPAMVQQDGQLTIVPSRIRHLFPNPL